MFLSRLLRLITPTVLILFFLLCLATPFASAAAVLPASEVQALREIGQTLGKTNWNFSVDPCSGQYGWGIVGSENAVTCNCSFSNNTTCHVISVVLKTQKLQGTLPRQFINLPYLIEIDLTRNYLNGTIPPEWGSLNLLNISLLANQLTGPIPKEIGNITTLKSLVLEFNQLSGALPPELGNLPRIQRFFLTSNYFTGEIPATFSKLASLKDLRLGDNQFTGKIPSFIQNWTNLEKLVIQGSGLQGPIPPEIASLNNLLDLRISDLNGTGTPIPRLFINLSMKTLILRSCNLVGSIPDYILQLAGLKILDLSFNNLTGPIPGNFESLSTINYLYLTGNSLTGPVPDWIFHKQKYIDLSYNNFTITRSSCQESTVNLFASSPKTNNSGLVSCLRNLRCPQNFYSIHINCGGSKVTVGNTLYDDDSNQDGPSHFFKSDSNWAYSSTGVFMDDEPPLNTYVWSNTSHLSIDDPRLYMTARFSPLSLTYYGFCLMNGNYTVDLHFTEIVFSDDVTYISLGRRIFDVYIQGQRVLQDFNIAAEAGGNGKATIKTFTASVTDATLEIRLFWAGKGTVSIPTKGDYGPLISAISVTPNFDTPKEPGKGSSISAAAVGGIAVAGVAAVVMLAGIIWWMRCRRHKDFMEEDLKGLDLQTSTFTLRQLKAATNNFDLNNKIGEGGFGSVYKGRLSDGTTIAVKQLSSKSRQGNREFINEIGMISALQHPHLVKLYGCCIEGNQLLLIYEFMENNSLARALFGPKELQLNLDWPARHRICVGIARGLAFLHEESRLKIVHRDIKATNVLLDKNFIPKISDFGLAKLDEEDKTHISTRIAGTYGYMAPEYAMRGHLTDKADVYSFGIVMLEIVSGRSNTSYHDKEESFYLLDWAHLLQKSGDLMDLVDPRLGVEFDKKEVMVTINIALLCTEASPAIRPAMSSVVSMLEGNLMVPSPAVPLNLNDEITSKAMRSNFQGTKVKKVSEIETQSMLIDAPLTTCSPSAGDLYPIDPDSSYWHGRD